MKKSIIAAAAVALLSVAGSCFAASVDDLQIQRNNGQNINLNYNSIIRYRDAMYRYNYQIQEVATDNNSYGATWGLYDRARNLLYSIQATKRNYNYEFGNDFSSPSNTLRRLFELEEIRIGAMVDGIYARLQGRDPMPYFRRGTSAAYEFDDLLERFQRM